MHTLKVIAAGFLLLGIFLIVAQRFGSPHTRISNAAGAFVPVWLVASLGNLLVGVVTAGYTVAQEAPVFLVVFGIPTAAALIIRWKYPVR